MQWKLVARGSAGLLGLEVYRRENKKIQTESEIQDRYFVKLYVYDTVVKLSGSPKLILKKLQELSDVVSMSMEIVYKDAEDMEAMREVERIQREAEQEQIKRALAYADQMKEKEEEGEADDIQL